MGWLPSSWWSSSSKRSTDFPLDAPNHEQRTNCWEARDKFYACLDSHSIINSIAHSDEARSKCGYEFSNFEQKCASSWVKYFQQKRVTDFKKKQMEELLTNQVSDK